MSLLLFFGGRNAGNIMKTDVKDSGDATKAVEALIAMGEGNNNIFSIKVG